MSLRDVSKTLDFLVFGCVDGVLAHERSVSSCAAGGFTLERRIVSGFAVLIIVILILDTALLAALHELLEGGRPPTAALEELLDLRHCQVPCAKNVNIRVEVDFLCKFVSLLMKPQMFLDRRFSTHCWDTRGPNESPKNGESRVQNRSGCTAHFLQDSMRTMFMARCPHRCIRTKQAERPMPHHGFRHNGQQSSERLHKNKSEQEQRFNHGSNSRWSARGWRTVASKSTSTHALLPAMSSIALETRAVHSR